MTLPIFIAAGSYTGGLLILAALTGQAVVNGRKGYAGRHRGTGRMTRRGENELRTGTVESRHRYATHQELRAEFDPKAVEAALKEPTQSLFLPDWDDMPEPVKEYGPGSNHYQVLRQRALDAQIAADRTAARLRRTVPLGPETDDEWIEVAA